MSHDGVMSNGGPLSDGTTSGASTTTAGAEVGASGTVTIGAMTGPSPTIPENGGSLSTAAGWVRRSPMSEDATGGRPTTHEDLMSTTRAAVLTVVVTLNRESCPH